MNANIMDVKGKKILVIGLAVSGLQTARTLQRLGAQVMVNDRKDEKELKETIALLRGMDIHFELGGHPIELSPWPDFAVISPGIPLDIPMVQRIMQSGREVISEVELAQRLTDTPIVAITGTNGKTTTTVLTGEIFRLTGRNTHVVGNVGVPIIERVSSSRPEDILIAEISSFQLEGTEKFKPAAAAVLNITPDHLDRHKTFSNYVDIKSRILRNQGPEDFAVLNADDPIVSALGNECKAHVRYFSRRRKLDAGAFVEDGYLVIKKGKTIERVCSIKDLKIPGDHNLENALAAAALTWCMDVPIRTIGKALISFGGVEHRLEYVDTIKGVKYINDSKGTNIEASVNAIKAMPEPIVLIAGGYDRGNDFDGFVQRFNGKVKGMILMGATAEKLKDSCQRANLNNIYEAKDMKEAVEMAVFIAEEGDTVLLSPACASWDMYLNFEERGNEFKKAVVKVRRSC